MKTQNVGKQYNKPVMDMVSVELLDVLSISLSDDEYGALDIYGIPGAKMEVLK